jgi:8-oxo-dGTP pyrophosphatase MutT (NUDIX family)
MEAGETEAETALRELLEETGLTAQLDTARSATIEYPISPIGRKQVVFFPGQVSGTPKAGHGEIDAFRWAKAEELKDYLFPDTVAACEPLL